MGNEASSKPSCPYTHGYHVLRVKDQSPGNVAGLQTFFDVITEANGVLLESSNSPFLQLLHENKDKPVSLRIYNIKDEQVRETEIVPRQWMESPNELFGISIRHTSIKEANEFVWHVLEVFPNSPASVAGFRAHTDYIIASDKVFFQDSEDFFNLINDNIGKALSLVVYNSVSEDIRSVVITPNKSWGGPGSLGCNVAFGFLHKIPTKSSPSAPANQTHSPLEDIKTLPVNNADEKLHVVSKPVITSINTNISSRGEDADTSSVDERVQQMLQQLDEETKIDECVTRDIETTQVNKEDAITEKKRDEVDTETMSLSIQSGQEMHETLPTSVPTSQSVVLQSPKSPIQDLSELKTKQQDLQEKLLALRTRMRSDAQ